MPLISSNTILIRRLSFYLILAVLSLAAIVIAFNRNSENVRKTYAEVERAESILHVSDQLIVAVLNIESYSRGFVLTGDTFFLTAFDRGAKVIPFHLEEFENHFSHHRFKAQLQQLHHLVGERLAYARELVQLSKAGRSTEVKALLATGKGKNYTEKIKLVLHEITGEVKTMLTERKKNYERSNKNTGVLFSVLMTFIAIILLTVAFQITKNHRLRNRHEEELNIYKHFFNNSKDLACITSVSGRFQKFNPHFQNQLGYDPEEILDSELITFVHPDDKASTGEKLSRLQTGETITNVQNRYRKKDGSYLWLEWNASPDKELSKLFVIARNITERKEATEQLIAATHEMEAFSYSVSHDLRAPLRAINGFAAILKEDYAQDLDDYGKETVDVIISNSKKMGELIDALLRFSKLGRKQLHIVPVNMEDLVRSVVEEIKAAALPTIQWEIGELLPSSADPILLRQVWMNLISNAVKYSGGKENPQITVGSYSKDHENVYFVKDNGAGFDMAFYNKLFGVFQRLHSQEEFEGTGIGLAMVMKIVSRHAGKLWADSRVGEGAIFYFSLPHINQISSSHDDQPG